MDNTYIRLLTGIRKFFDVNDVLRSDLNNTCIEFYNMSLDKVLEIWAEVTAKSPHVTEAIDYLDDLNSDPHYISEMIEMYDFIDDFSLIYQEAENV